jgi:hypothetical protein
MDKSNEAYYLNKYKYPEQQDQSNNDKKKGKKDKKNDGLSKEEKMAQKELKKKRMQELYQKKNKKETSGLANAKKYIDKTKPGEKRIYLENCQNIMILLMFRVLGTIGGQKNNFSKLT